MKYQIYYKNQEEFDKLEKLLLDNRGYNCSKKYPNNKYIVPTSYNWYILTKNLEFIGMNCDKVPEYKTITIEELEELYKKEKLMSKQEFNQKVYHFVIKDDIHREFAIALLEKYNFKWWNGKILRIVINELKLPYCLLIEQTMEVDWNNLADSHIHPIISLNDFENLLKYFSENKRIQINNMEVIFNDDKSISVGCTTIPFETLNEIWNELNKNSKNEDNL